MMKDILESSTFTVPLSSSVHDLASQFGQQQSNTAKAKQVYLNTLAVSAVNLYLRCMGIQTDWQASASYNPVIQALMDIADLEVTGLGKLECRPVLPDATMIAIPEEVWSGRIGYIVVQLDSLLKEATLLGFTATVPESGELPIAQLRSLDDLMVHLDYLRLPQPVEERVNLSQWFDNCFEKGWQSLQAILGTETENLAYSFRSTSEVNKSKVIRAKLIDLGLQLENQTLAMLMAITPEVEQKVGILVQLHPVSTETYLPPNLKLALLSESGKTFQEAQSRCHDNYIQLKRFRGVPGECFNIQVAFGNSTIIEKFII
ncbi:MAG: DUF1822 family protein [Coleofasciculaceae cyanobacterium]